MVKPAPVKPTISIDVLEQVDVRVGTIERVEDVPGSTYQVASEQGKQQAKVKQVRKF